VVHVASCRIDEAAERAAAVRAELQEGRKKLRELVDAEKESRKRKCAAALALATVSLSHSVYQCFCLACCEVLPHHWVGGGGLQCPLRKAAALATICAC
jgi:hypothetical protein